MKVHITKRICLIIVKALARTVCITLDYHLIYKHHIISFIFLRTFYAWIEIAGSLESLCDIMSNNALDVYDTIEDRSTMIQVAQDLGAAVTRIVIIVDSIVCDHFLLSKSKVRTIFPNYRFYLSIRYFIRFYFVFHIQQVSNAFSKLEAVAHYTEFVRAYTSYSTEIVELTNLICKWSVHANGIDRLSNLIVEKQFKMHSCTFLLR